MLRRSGSRDRAKLKDGRVFGVGTHGQSDHGRAAIWDPQAEAAGFWTTLHGAPERDWELFARLPDGRLMFLLENHRGTGPNRVALWNPRTGALDDTLPMHENRAHAAAIVTPVGEVIAIGGEDVRTREWTALPSLNAGRYQVSAVAIRGLRILVGGPPASGIELWDPQRASGRPSGFP